MLAFQWLPLDSWIVAVGALSAMSAALLGNFLVLRRMSMMGDAISHAVLPGLAIAFLITGTRDSIPMLVGAGLVGVLTAVITQWIHTTGKVDEGASMGVVFTVLFAIGLILIVRAADSVDLDPGCVLYGAIETTPLDTVAWGRLRVPRAGVTNGAVLLVNLLFVTLLYKELKVSTFDPALATTLGINAQLMHYLLMTLVAVTTVAAFESVGSILVIAMLIVPAATAHLLTDRLSVMLVLSLVLAAGSAFLGHVSAIVVPGWLGFDGVSTSTAGMMAVCAGALLGVAVLVAPRHGVVSRVVHRVMLSVRIVRDDLLGMLYRLEELGRVATREEARRMARGGAGTGVLFGRVALASLCRSGHLETDRNAYRLTASGREAARQLLRSHRLWETYLARHIQMRDDHLHGSAERLEHVTSPVMQARLNLEVERPTHDPHGHPIPPLDEGEGTSRPTE